LFFLSGGFFFFFLGGFFLWVCFAVVVSVFVPEFNYSSTFCHSVFYSFAWGPVGFLLSGFWIP